MWPGRLSGAQGEVSKCAWGPLCGPRGQPPRTSLCRHGHHTISITTINTDSQKPQPSDSVLGQQAKGFLCIIYASSHHSPVMYRACLFLLYREGD